MVMEDRYLKTLYATSVLLKCGIWAYSPIVHCHHMSQVFGMPKDHKFWLDYDRAMILSARGIQVLTLPGWERSVGVKNEIEFALTRGKPITYLSPGVADAHPTTIPNRNPA